MTGPESARAGRARWALWATAAGLVAAILGPLVRPGYVLSYDMVFVPDQRLSWHLVAPADALPRAVPLDAVVAVASLIAPGWLLQRVALVAIIVAAALGAARVMPTDRTAVRIVAAVGYVWTPFLAERLLIGQWALLCAYAALPWLVAAAVELRRPEARQAFPVAALARLVVAAAAASLTPTGGVIALVVVAGLLLGAVRLRVAVSALVAAVALNLPWLVASVVSRAGGRSDPDGVAAFAARAENWSGVLGALAGTGGIWNRLTTPTSRASALVPLVTLALLGLAVLGWPRLRAGFPSGLATRLAALAAGGFALALTGATPPGSRLLRGLVETVPGAGLLRDGQKFVLPYALLLVLAAAAGLERVMARLGPEAGRAVLAGALVLPVLALPDLAWGGAGALRPVSYPDDWAVVARTVAADPGELIALPFAEYRKFGWNHGRVVIDPAPRYFPVPVVTDDALVVGDQVVEGEDARAAHLRERLAGGAPVAGLGPQWILIEGPGVPESTLDGLQLVYRGSDLTLYRDPDPDPDPAPTAATGQRVAAVVSYSIAGLAVLTGLVFSRWRRRSR
jgi:hypothetical protein